MKGAVKYSPHIDEFGFLAHTINSEKWENPKPGCVWTKENQFGYMKLFSTSDVLIFCSL